MINQVASPWSPKLLWLMVPAMGGSALWWYIVSQTLEGRVGFTTAALPTLLTFLVFGVFAFGAWLGTFGLIAYISHNRIVRLVNAIIVSLPLLIWFPIAFWTLIALGLTFMSCWLGIERLNADQHNRLAVRPQLSLGAFSITTTIIMVAVSLLYYQQLRGSSDTSEQLANRLSGQTVDFAERLLPAIYKDYQPNQTVDEFILGQFPKASDILDKINFDQIQDSREAEAKIRDELAHRELDAETFDVPGQVSQDQIRQQLEAELKRQEASYLRDARERAAEQIGIEIQGDEKFHDVLTRLVNKQFDQSVKRYVESIPWLLAAALFFLLKIFTGVFILSVAWTGWAFFRFYRSLHIVKIDHDMVPAEKVVWL